MKYELGTTKTDKGNIVFTKAKTLRGVVYYLYDSEGVFCGEITKEQILKKAESIKNLTVTADNRLIYKKLDDIENLKEIIKSWSNYYGPDGKAIINRVLREYGKDNLKDLKKLGYDGIIIKNSPVGIKDKKTISMEVIVFEPNQIKSIYNGRPKDSSNLYDGFKDITIKGVLKEQQAYFKDSKIYDVKGNLIVMHHCTNAEFNSFDKSCIGEGFGSCYGQGFYFSSEVLNEYGKDVPVYLNVKKPYIISNVNDMNEVLAYLYTCGVK